MESSTILEAIVWLDTHNGLGLIFDSPPSTLKKELHAPIELIDYVQKSPSMLLDERSSEWPNDKFLSSGAHTCFIIRPIANQDLEAASTQTIDNVFATLFLEFSMLTHFTKEDLLQLDGLCIQAIFCLKSVVRKKQLVEASQ